MSLAKKLWIAFGVLIVLTSALGVSFFVAARLVDDRATALSGDSLPGVYVLGKVETLAARLENMMLMHINSASKAEMNDFEKDIDKAESEIKGQVKDYRSSVTAPEELRMYIRLQPAIEELMAAWVEARVPSRASKNNEAMTLFRKEVSPQSEKLAQFLKEEYDYNKTNTDASTISLLNTASNSRTTACILSLVVVLLGAGLASNLIRDITARLGQAMAALSEGTQQIRFAAEQVASSSQLLAQGASEQAASLQETSASGQEITAMTQRNSQNSATTATLMNEMDQSMTEANNKLRQLVLGMEDISRSSDQIASIIKVIDEIAFQTNILALNAAVEAARAGEAGMGFAVVADEVRNLAQRCGQATKDITGMIEGSISSTRNGSSRLAEVTKVIAYVTDRTVRARTLIDELHLGGAEQTRGIDQIARALVQMEQITQQVAASAEESASASEELNGQAGGMGAFVQDLRLLVAGRG